MPLFHGLLIKQVHAVDVPDLTDNLHTDGPGISRSYLFRQQGFVKGKQVEFTAKCIVFLRTQIVEEVEGSSESM